VIGCDSFSTGGTILGVTCLVLVDTECGGKKKNNVNLSHHVLQTGALHTLRTNRSHVVVIIFLAKLIKNYSAKDYRVHMPNIILD